MPMLARHHLRIPALKPVQAVVAEVLGPLGGLLRKRAVENMPDIAIVVGCTSARTSRSGWSIEELPIEDHGSAQRGGEKGIALTRLQARVLAEVLGDAVAKDDLLRRAGRQVADRCNIGCCGRSGWVHACKSACSIKRLRDRAAIWVADQSCVSSEIVRFVNLDLPPENSTS